MSTSLWPTILSAGAIGALATLLGALVTHWGQARRDTVTYRRARADARCERLRQEYIAVLSALEACDQLLYRASIFQWLSPEAAARLSAQISTTQAAFNQAMAAIRLHPEIPDVGLLMDAIGLWLCDVTSELDAWTQDQAEEGGTLLTLSNPDMEEVEDAIDQLLNVMRGQLARLEQT